MKKFEVICLSILIVITIAGISYYNYLVSLIDVKPPIIKIKQNNLEYYEFDNFNYYDFIDVYDDSGEYSVSIIDEKNAYTPGKKTVVIEATDSSSNTSYASIFVNIISSQEWNNYVNQNTYNYIYHNSKNDSLIDIKGYADPDAFKLAQEFIGMKGSCDEVAQAFIDTYFGEGYSVLVGTYNISLEEAMPGDIIYYANGGIGLQHYAVYLGGSSALHGNINGTTIIGNVYMANGSSPQFKRIEK